MFIRPSFGPLWFRWTEPDSYYAHGPIGLALFCWIAFKNRNNLVPLAVKQKWPLAFLFLSSLGTVYFQYLNINFGAYLSIFGIILSFVLWNFGFSGVKTLRWAFLFLILSIPLPSAFLVHISFFLRQLSVLFVYVLMQLTSLEIKLDGNVIHFGSNWVRVADACSGLRTLVSVVAVCSFLAYREESKRRQIIIFALAIPSALVGNILRILIVSYGIYIKQAELFLGPLHEFIGILALLIALGIVILCSRLVKEDKDDVESETVQLKENTKKLVTGRTAVLLAFLFTILSFTNYKSQNHTYDENFVSHQAGEKSNIGDWMGIDLGLSDIEKQILKSKDVRYRRLNKINIPDPIYYFELNLPLNESAIHPPEISLKSEGYEVQNRQTVELKSASETWPAEMTLYHGQKYNLLVYNWYFVNNYKTHSFIKHQLLCLLEFIQGRQIRAGSRRISIELPLNSQAAIDAGNKAIVNFASQL